MRISDCGSDIPVDEVLAASRRPEVIKSMREFYAEVDRRIAEHSPTCWNSGACCRFGEYGHRLYVTALEVAYYLATTTDADRLAPSRATGEVDAPAALLPVLAPPITADACPHAHHRECHVREARPLSCRIFYCDPNAQHWQGPFTEECLQELKRVHRELGVPYFYADWMSVLRALRERSAAA